MTILFATATISEALNVLKLRFVIPEKCFYQAFRVREKNKDRIFRKTIRKGKDGTFEYAGRDFLGKKVPVTFTLRISS